MSWLQSIRETLDNNAPTYRVLKRIDNSVEIRVYEKLKWIAASTKCKPEEFAQNQGYLLKNILSFVNCNNDQNLRMNRLTLCTPFVHCLKNTTRERITSSSLCQIDYMVYVPKDMSPNFPKPITSDVEIREDEQVEFAVISFGGYPSFEDFFNYRDILITRLGSEASKYDTVNFWIAGYNSPLRFFYRRNEIWLRRVAF
jgi:hypothetical protein